VKIVKQKWKIAVPTNANQSSIYLKKNKYFFAKTKTWGTMFSGKAGCNYR